MSDKDELARNIRMIALFSELVTSIPDAALAIVDQALYPHLQPTVRTAADHVKRAQMLSGSAAWELARAAELL